MTNIDFTKIVSNLPLDFDTSPDGCETESYLSVLEGVDISENEKRELIHFLWSVCESVVHIGFGIDPVQTALNTKSEVNR